MAKFNLSLLLPDPHEIEWLDGKTVFKMRTYASLESIDVANLRNHFKTLENAEKSSSKELEKVASREQDAASGIVNILMLETPPEQVEAVPHNAKMMLVRWWAENDVGFKDLTKEDENLTDEERKNRGE